MRINFKIVLLIMVTLISKPSAQPFIYYQIPALGPDTSDEYNYYKTIRLDLKMNISTDFDYIGKGQGYHLDQEQKYLVIDEYNQGVFLYDIKDSTFIDELPGGFVSGILCSYDKNRLYIFGENGFGTSKGRIYEYDLFSNTVISFIDFNQPSSDVNPFFSFDGYKIYFNSQDTLTRINQLWTYSINTHQITSKQNLLTLGCPNAEYSEITRGRNGMGIVTSRAESLDTFYYRIYDFDNLIGYNFIARPYPNDEDPYFTNDGKYFIFCEIGHEPDTIGFASYLQYYTGKVDIYDNISSELLKTIQLPERGKFYYFDNYPNNVYYIKNIESPDRQIFVLNMDSIFNDLDLSSLTPPTINVNSSSFTLTVKGIGFDTVSTIYFNGQPRTTTFISDSVLTAEILSSDVSVIGSFPVWVKDRYSISDTLQFNVTQASNPSLLVRLINSQGIEIPASNVQYYDAGWKDAVNNGDGTFTVITTRPTVSIRVYYEYASMQADNVPAQNNTYTFQTVNATVQLKNSLGNLIDTGTVQYYAGAWRSFGTTSNGVAYKELLPINYSFRMSYEYGSQDKQQNLSADPTVVFQTVNTAVQLKNSLGNLIDAGTVQYYAGAWRSFGTTSNGVAYKELLPINYSFRMTYEYGIIDKQQNLSSDPTVIFQTVNAAVQLKNSLGNLIDAGTVQYYAGAWRTFGTTVNGVAYKELLPINYSFRMTYEYGSIDKQQNLSSDPTVVFQTVNAAVQLKNSLGSLIDQGTVQYYAGAWRSFGTTSNGVAYKELLPINYSFRMTYEFVSKDKQQNLGTNPVVDFNTVLCSVKVSKTSNNQPINNAEVKYYSGAWRNLGTTNVDGITTKELLPASLSFRATLGNVSQDKQQDISVNSLVEILLNIP